MRSPSRAQNSTPRKHCYRPNFLKICFQKTANFLRHRVPGQDKIFPTSKSPVAGPFSQILKDRCVKLKTPWGLELAT